MARLKKKNHIYTFVLGKKMTKTALCVAVAIVLGFGASYIAGKCEGEKYTKFLKFSSANVLKGKREKQMANIIGADDILRQTWPVFMPSEVAVSVFNPKGADINT